MKFCECCENMLYVNVEDDKLVYYCKNCKNTETVLKGQSVLIIDDNKIDDEARYSHYINRHLKHDPTLPRVNNIVCPNKECIKKKEDNNEVIYIKYDHTNMQYLYYCCHCEYFWKRNSTIGV